MKRILTIIALSIVVIILAISIYKSNDSKGFSLFVMRGIYNPGLKSDYFGDINENTKTITMLIPIGTDIKALKPSYNNTGKTVLVGSQIQKSDLTEHDFSQPVHYRIVANNFTSVKYTVKMLYAEKNTIDRQAQYIRLKRLAELREPKLLKNMSDFDKAITLRNHVYQTTPTMKATSKADVNDLFEYYFYGSIHPEFGQLCGGMSITYQSLLEAFNIPSRAVYMFSKTENYDSHVSVEFYANGKWMMSDPTFNAMAKYNGRYISYEELRKLLLAGKKVIWDTNNMVVNKSSTRTIENYYISTKELLSYLVVAPSAIKTNGKIVNYPPIFYPQQWDKHIKVKDESVFIPDIDFYPDHPQMRASMGEHRFAY